MKNDIMAQIVLFNPEIIRLMENICSIIEQVDKVYIFDNGSDNIDEVERKLCELAEGKKIELCKNQKNSGISYALNRGMEYAISNNFSWVLTLDQDSIFPKGGVELYRKYIEKDDAVAIMCPVIVDRNLGIMGGPEGAYQYVSKSITSGSLTRVGAWKEIGGYDEWLFIDVVDYEFSWRIKKGGYKILQVNDLRLLHELGHCKVYYIFKHRIIVYNYSPFRLYYQVRNNLYFEYKTGKKVTFFRIIKKVMHYSGVVFLFEHDKFEKIKAIIKGALDFVRKEKELDIKRIN